MHRLALALAVALAALHAPAARAEPYDVDLSRLGPPDPVVWTVIATRNSVTLAPGEADALAVDAKKRFAVLSCETALALSAPVLEPASTTGHAGFDFALEGAYVPVHGDAVGVARFGFSSEPWATRSETPSALTTTGVHVRKALPFSFEFGGRLTYLNQSSYFAAQGEAKWALNEGFETTPDLAIRIAYTRLFGQKDWNLGATDLDFLISKRWGVSAVTSFTPYLAARFTFVNASSEMIDFQSIAPGSPLHPPAPTDHYESVAGFPNLRVGLYRTTLGVRMTASVVSLALEATYFAGKRYSGEDAPARDEYADFELDSALSAAFRLGWEF
jgi:hypothetical protein